MRLVNWNNPVNWQHPLNRGLLGWWLNTPNARGGTTFRDLVGRHDGTLTSMDPATDWVGPQGRRGGWGALDFDGTDDEVGLTGLPFIAPPFTLSMWAKDNTPTFDNQYRHIISRGSVAVADTNYAVGTRRRNTGSQNRLFFYWKNGGSFYGSESAVDEYVLGEWMHIVATIDAAFDSVVYLNGVSVFTDTSNAIPIDGGQTSLIGGPDLVTSSSDFFIGLIDDVRIVNRVWSASEVTQYNQLSRRDYPGLLRRLTRRMVKAPAAGGSLLPQIMQHGQYTSGGSYHG